MKRVGTLAGLTAIAFVVFYQVIPFLVVSGAPDGLGKLSPLLAVEFVAMRSFWVLCAGAPESQAHRLGRASLFWFSAVAGLSMVLFPEAIANFLASVLQG